MRAKSTPAARAGDLTVPTSRAPREDGKLVLAVRARAALDRAALDLKGAFLFFFILSWYLTQ